MEGSIFQPYDGFANLITIRGSYTEALEKFLVGPAFSNKP